jgi:hypothetical protein
VSRGRHVATLAEQWLSEARFVVCETAAVPVASAAAGGELAQVLAATCPYEHTVETVNLRPIDRQVAASHWRRHAWGHGPDDEARMVSLLPGHPILGNSPLQVEVKRALGRPLD